MKTVTNWDHTNYCGVFWRGFSCSYPHREGDNLGDKVSLFKGSLDVWVSPSATGWV